MNCIRLFLYTIIVVIFSHSTLPAQQKQIAVNYIKTDIGYTFYGSNNGVVPYYLKFQFSELKNLKSNQLISSYTPVIKANSTNQELLTLIIDDQSKSSEFNFNYVYTIGEPEKIVDKDYPYLLPYQHGKRYRVAQGNNGKGTHRGINALDFNLNIGDSIYAARGGIVYDVKEDSNTGGNNMSFEDKGNYINIYHEDGTIAKYVHLKIHGALVQNGDEVKAGELIGISGNTGYSSGPHLHFALVHNDAFQTKTLQAKFINHEEVLFFPIEGQAYYAYHPGKADFEVIDNNSFKEEAFEKASSTSNLAETIEIETESYSDYTLLYVNNGFSNKVQGTLRLSLTNMESTKEIPYTFTVEANTRMYLLAIKPRRASEKYGYEVSAAFRK